MEDIENSIPNESLLIGTRSEEKHIRVSESTHDIVSRASENRNRKMSQGTVSYEILQMTQNIIDDKVDKYEKRVNDALDDENINSEAIDKIKYTDPIHIDGENEEEKRIRVWLPYRIATSIEQRDVDLSEYIEKSVQEYVKTPFRDRLHRIEVKEELLKYTKRDNKKLNGLSEEIKDNSDRLHIPDDIGLTLNIESISDYMDYSNRLTRWEDRIDKFNKVTDMTDIDKCADMLADIHDIQNTNDVKNYIRQHSDTSRFNTVSKLPDLETDENGEAIVGKAAIYAEEHTVQEVIKAYVKDDIDKENRLTLQNLKIIYKVLCKSDVIKSEEFENFIKNYIINNDNNMKISKSKDKDFVMYYKS